MIKINWLKYKMISTNRIKTFINATMSEHFLFVVQYINLSMVNASGQCWLGWVDKYMYDVIIKPFHSM